MTEFPPNWRTDKERQQYCEELDSQWERIRIWLNHFAEYAEPSLSLRDNIQREWQW